MEELRDIFLGVGLVAFFISFPLGFFLARKSIKQILEIEKIARNIVNAKNFSCRVPISGSGDEVDQLAITFNLMLEKLELYFRELLQIFDNLAHDFKNLLSHLRLLAEKALESKNTKEKEELIVRILYEADKFLSLLNVLLDLSEAETQLLTLKKQKASVKEILEEVDQIFRDLAISKGLKLKIIYPEREEYLLVDKKRFLQAFTYILLPISLI